MSEEIISWFTPLWDNLLSFFVPIWDFFGSLLDIIWNILTFIANVVSFIWTWIATWLSYVWSLIEHLFALSFWYDLFNTFKQLSIFLWVDTIYLVMMFFVLFILIIFTFITRLIFWKLNFVNFDPSYKKKK